MDEYGYIKLSRKITDMDSYFGERFNRFQCWVDLLLLAEWKPRVIYIRGNRVDIQRGQVAESVKTLSERWSMSPNTVRGRLSELEKEGRIRIEHSSVLNLITIVKYNQYQDVPRIEQQKPIENKGRLFDFDQQTDQQTDQPYNKIKKEKNINNKGGKNKFCPPTLEEVRSYIQEKGYSVDADTWWNFYESKGWFVGKNKMKNWHAAIATWQRKDNERLNLSGNAANRQRTEDKRRGTQIDTTTAGDYTTTF